MTDKKTSTTKAEQIAQLNDRFRRSPGANWVITASVQAKGAEFIRRAVQAVVAFDHFPEGDNPHGERDFGAFDLSGQRLFWKIDYYDHALEYGSPDPTNPTITQRVMTIMLAEDY
jgi:hypothetical protein